MDIFDRTITSHTNSLTAHLNEEDVWRIWLSNAYSKLFESSVNIEHYSADTVRRLKTSGVPLTKKQENIRREIILKLSFDLDAIIDAMVIWVLAEHVKDYRQAHVINFKPVIPNLVYFYEAATHENVFLIVEIHDNDTVLAIEVNPTSDKVIGLVKLLIKQLKETHCVYNKRNFALEEFLF